MIKVIPTADKILQVIQGVLVAPEINTTLTGEGVPTQWKDKPLAEILNVEYFTFKRRAKSREQLKQMFKDNKQGKVFDKLHATDKGICCFVMGMPEHLFDEDTDMSTSVGVLDYWIQTSKIKLLEQMFNQVAVLLAGERIQVVIDGQDRMAMVEITSFESQQPQTESVIGESVRVTVGVEVTIMQPVTSWQDYAMRVRQYGATTPATPITFPIIALRRSSVRNQDGVPFANDMGEVGNINYSRTTAFKIIFGGFHNAFIDWLADIAFSQVRAPEQGQIINNERILFDIIRRGREYRHDLVIAEQEINVDADTGVEIHTLSVSTRGL